MKKQGTIHSDFIDLNNYLSNNINLGPSALFEKLLALKKNRFMVDKNYHLLQIFIVLVLDNNSVKFNLDILHSARLYSSVFV